jgi:hypothetical protein
MNRKDIFIEEMKKRTKKFSVDIILFCESLETVLKYKNKNFKEQLTGIC